ncbi:MAG TPA: AMP-binding protein, partial [Archangium sp.]|nr:AMP-binding protein [Archangium sp.]
MATSLLETFLTRARQTPGWPVLDFEQRRFTAGQLASRAAAFASALQRRGLKPGERVALFLENSPAFVLAYLGTQYAGGVVVLVNTQYRQVELGHILADAGARACVTGAAGAAELSPLKASLPALEWLVTVEPPTAPVPWPTV